MFSSFFMFTGESKAAFNPDTYYTSKSPYTAVYGGSGTCADSGVQKGYKQITNLGYVELKFSTVCKTAWAKLTRYSKALLTIQVLQQFIVVMVCGSIVMRAAE
ncbi:DUF2690 domain-containing protein [Bacillus cereus group sp. MG9]|uniref:DUF2690 domain-containing protein n=1 Tax=Bacillus cereus group sp. MG9 TaxID=3040247 RepID=UPI00339284DA